MVWVGSPPLIPINLEVWESLEGDISALAFRKAQTSIVHPVEAALGNCTVAQEHTRLMWITKLTKKRTMGCKHADQHILIWNPGDETPRFRLWGACMFLL